MQFLSREFLYVTISKPLSNFHLLGSFLEHSRDMMVIMCLVRSLFEYRLNIFFSGLGSWGHFEPEAQALGSKWPPIFLALLQTSNYGRHFGAVFWRLWTLSGHQDLSKLRSFLTLMSPSNRSRSMLISHR